MKEIDAKGLDCPAPVVKTKKALEDNDELLTIVDNEVAANNVKKLAVKLGCEVEVNKENDKLYKLKIKKVNNQKEESEEESKDDDNAKIYFFKSDKLGKGEDELGNVLIKGFIHTLLDVEPLPEKIIFMNAGVKIPTQNKDAIDSLKELEDKGVSILSCGTCLDYYQIKDELEVGSISNMYEIVENLNSKEVVVI